MTGWVTTVGGVILLVAAVATLLRKAGLGMIRTVRKFSRLADEILGDGDKKQGWGRRLAAIEQDVIVMKTKITATLAEVKPNGGSSLKDQIGRIERATGATQEDPAE